MTTRTVGNAALAIVAALVGACSSEVKDASQSQRVSDGAVASSGGAHAAGGATTGGSPFDGGRGGASGGDATTVLPDAQVDVSTDHQSACLPPLAADAGITATYECSSDVTRPTSWNAGWGDCGKVYNTGCPARFGCGTFDVTREGVRACRALRLLGPPYEGREYGFRVIVDSFGPSQVRMYFDEETGKMVGYFEMDDVGYIICAGRVPEETFLARFGGYTTDIVPLCEPDGGPLVDAGGDEPSVDAGDSG